MTQADSVLSTPRITASKTNPPDQPMTRDDELGMAWWNSLTKQEREKWSAVAGNTGRVKDAWEAFKRGSGLELRGAPTEALAALFAGASVVSVDTLAAVGIPTSDDPGPPRARRRAALLFVLTQQLASLPIEKVHPQAGGAGDRLILVFRRVLIVIQPMLDLHRCYRAGEKERGHRTTYDSSATSEHDIAQGFRGGRFVFRSRPHSGARGPNLHQQAP